MQYSGVRKGFQCDELDYNSDSFDSVIASRIVFNVYKTEWTSCATMGFTAVCQNVAAPSQLSTHKHGRLPETPVIQIWTEMNCGHCFSRIAVEQKPSFTFPFHWFQYSNALIVQMANWSLISVLCFRIIVLLYALRVATCNVGIVWIDYVAARPQLSHVRS